MKIGIITDSIRDNSTGIGYYAKDIILKILKKDKRNKYFFIDYLKTSFNHKKLIYINSPFKYFKTTLWHVILPSKIKNLDLDLIINLSGCPHFFKYRQKEIFFVYDISWYLYPRYHPFSRVFMYRLSFRRCLKNCYKIVVDSISTKNDLIKYFSIQSDKILVVYPKGPQTLSYRKTMNIQIDFPYILFIGTLEPRKNVESIIRAYQLLKMKKNINQKLIICGKKGWIYHKIFKLIKKYQLDQYVVYKGYISQDEKAYLFRNAEFFVYPSYYEGFGIPILEAMCYGCPVITSNISSLPEVAGKAAIIIDPNNINELSKGMYDLLTKNQLRKKLINEGTKQVKKLDNARQIDNLLELIQDIKGIV